MITDVSKSRWKGGGRKCPCSQCNKSQEGSDNQKLYQQFITHRLGQENHNSLEIFQKKCSGGIQMFPNTR